MQIGLGCHHLTTKQQEGGEVNYKQWRVMSGARWGGQLKQVAGATHARICAQIHPLVLYNFLQPEWHFFSLK